MRIIIHPNPTKLGAYAAAFTAKRLTQAIAQRGEARLVLSTGASQLSTIEALIHSEVDWARVEMFHLDEYVGLPITHKASFRRYLQERFVDHLPLKAVHWVTDSTDCIPRLSHEIARGPVDIGLIGIGENAHIAFNDPPADFDDPAAFKVVTLDEACKRQQVREGWFDSLDLVPMQAISMTVQQIMRCETIVSCVPFAVKAEAIRKTLMVPQPDRQVPASILKTHPDFYLHVDEAAWDSFNPADIRMPEGKIANVRHEG
jgi:glucosamine-6-phosphate deaminase